MIPSTPTRADFAAFPTNNPAALASAVNSAFAAVYASEGYTSTNTNAEFLVNAEQVLLNPLASPPLRLAVYVALANLPGVGVKSGAKDANGHAGIMIFGTISGNVTLDGDQLGYIFDPLTGNLLEDDIITPAGTAIAASTVTTFTTASTAPGNPYAN